MKIHLVIPLIVILFATARVGADDIYSGAHPAVSLIEASISDKPDALNSRRSIRVASYNIEHFTDGLDDDGGRTTAMAKQQAQMAATIIEKIHPDILMIMEIENATSLRLLNSKMTRPFPIGYITTFGTGHNHSKLNIAVLSRLPLEDVREIDFQDMKMQNRPPRGLLNFSVALGPKRELLVYGVHLKSNWGKKYKNIAKRRNGLLLLRKDEDALKSAAPDTQWEVLVMGDMNADPELKKMHGAPSLEPLADWADLWAGRTAEERVTLPTRTGDPNLEFDPATFDRIYASPELMLPPWRTMRPNTLQVGVVKQQTAKPGGKEGHVSDHYPVYVDILR